MPEFDGTGPLGQGPLSGRGEGHCAIKLSKSGEVPQGFAGIQGSPVSLDSLPPQPGIGSRLARWIKPVSWLGCTFRQGRGPGRSGSQRYRRR